MELFRLICKKGTFYITSNVINFEEKDEKENEPIKDVKKTVALWNLEKY